MVVDIARVSATVRHLRDRLGEHLIREALLDEEPLVLLLQLLGILTQGRHNLDR